MSLRAPLRHLPRQQPCLLLPHRLYSTTPPTPPPAAPLLLKLRNDLKGAMKSKDANRLTVLRMLLAEITNASKTSNPIKDDMQVLSLLRKRAAESRGAAGEFAAANRVDLKEKEEAQVAVMEEYAGGVRVIGEAEVRTQVEALKNEVVEAGEKVDKGKFLRRLIGPGGIFEGKAVEKSTVVRVAQEVLG